ncbi:hypothetical protein CC1G_05117 [Coprinopsis cinerea okayama7|uniref:Uncharacterized protein n=1 Tax=Coprinopsis cinerea (strain Okayama-7 / 130 / ATCC MYA-4618 / FGSC 9003) TaxID=240176 RepID=A8NFX2_COPC7|nr:hypothetical protein CC1G_05117 [Coprinopsis cinerea okayama7\|eukprot:XP_001833417.2 hypothetical protein CC1G_05117 [Coprinopsis cinerea okayama7\
MISVSRTRLEDDGVLGLQDSHGVPREIPLKVSVPSFDDHESRPILPRRAFGSVSTSDSDPFSEFQPWTALFQSKIWSPCKESLSGDIISSLHRPADIDEGDDLELDTMSVGTVEIVTLSPPSWLPSILDPTTLAFHFDHTCLQGLDGCLLHSPQVAFADLCWEAAITPGTPQKPSFQAVNDAKQAFRRDGASMAANDCSPPYRNSSISVETTASESPIPVFLAPSSWSDGTDDESDEEEGYEDDCYSTGTVTGAHGAHVGKGFNTLAWGPFLIVSIPLTNQLPGTPLILHPFICRSSPPPPPPPPPQSGARLSYEHLGDSCHHLIL